MSEPVPGSGPPTGESGAPGEQVPRQGAREQYPVPRARFRAWLVTGPVGRLVGFTLDFARALKAHRASKRG